MTASVTDLADRRPPDDEPDYGHIWYWRTRLPDRKGQPCRVLVRGRMNSVLVEFADGFKVVTTPLGDPDDRPSTDPLRPRLLDRTRPAA